MTHRLCVAPMMDWTDRHCRFFLRQVSGQVRLYTEMIPTGALLHGDAERHLACDPAEHPVAAQLGGCEPDELAACARSVERHGYDEIDLNVGCPSERVQKGAFGACLMAEPELVADCVRAMREAALIPVTVKHRTGVDSIEEYGFLSRFVSTIADAGCRTFIVHARNAILKGLSPRDNREIPPLKYDYVYQLKRDFPSLEIVLNGGISTREQIEAQLARVDGVMIGRAAYHNPWLIAQAGNSREKVVHAMAAYAKKETAKGASLRHIARHMLGLYHGHPRARLWRQMLSDSTRLARNDPQLFVEALETVESRFAQAA
jgi:tRNA-dihydrouridine synthase A